MGFMANIGSNSNTVAELWAVWQGLELVWNRGYRKVELESDSQVVIESLIWRIHELVSRNWEC